MKKICVSLMAMFIAVFSFALVGCGGNNNVIKLNEVTHSFFYAPMYAAINKGYFEDEGIKIELKNGGGADKSMTALLSGEADIGLMGPEAAIYVVKGGAKNKPVIFGQLTKRDGAFLVSKKDEAATFNWGDLAGKTIIGGRKGGVPAMTLQYVIEQEGLEIVSSKMEGKVHLRTDVDFNLTASVFDTTDADYCTLFEPNATQLANEGKGYIVASVGEKSGEVPYTAFMANQNFVNNNPDKIKAFLRAIIKGYQFITTGNMSEIVDSLAPSFPGVAREDIASAVNRYIQIDAWMNTPVMQESSFNRLQDIMINAGELTGEKVKFSSVVNNSFAEEVMAKYAG